MVQTVSVIVMPLNLYELFVNDVTLLRNFLFTLFIRKVLVQSSQNRWPQWPLRYLWKKKMWRLYVAQKFSLFPNNAKNTFKPHYGPSINDVTKSISLPRCLCWRESRDPESVAVPRTLRWWILWGEKESAVVVLGGFW